MGFKTAATADPFDIQEIATQDGILWTSIFESLDGMGQSTSGSGGVTFNINKIETFAGTTSGSHATVTDQVDFAVEAPTWAKDRTFKAGYNVVATDETHFIGTGVVSEGTFTNQHIGFKLSGGDLLGSVADGTTEATTSLVTGPSTGLKTVEARFVAGTSVEFFVDGTSQGTVSSNLPTSTLRADTIFTLHVENSTATNTSASCTEARVVQHP